jgi:hypothetical protein
MRVMTTAFARYGLLALIASALSSACSPTFDWREARFEGSTLVAMFPCRPDHHVRPIELAGRRVTMQMGACATGGATFAVSVVELGDPALAATAQQQLRTVAVANVRGDAPQAVPWRLAGTTPNTDASRISTRGRLPDGAAVVEHAAFFTQGLRVYQASVIGAAPNPEALETFFAGLKFVP